MLRRTIRATERTDVDAALAVLQRTCADAGISAQKSTLIVDHVGEVLRQLVDRGRQLASIGSQMRVTRNVSGAGYAIKLEFSANTKPSFFVKLLRIFRVA